MRSIRKGAVPQVLQDSGAVWLQAFLEDRGSNTRRYRYRDREIKECLLEETSSKCVYCESKIGHTSPGDVEHKIPSSLFPDRHFDWLNLTIACSECNRRKSNYYDAEKPFLDPYADDVETRVIHHGPVVGWPAGDGEAEITIRTLELNVMSRIQLILRKVEKLEQWSVLRDRVANESDADLRGILQARLQQMADPSSEYSGMIRTVMQG